MNNMSGIAEASRMPYIHEVIIRLGDEVARLKEEVQTLNSRLVPILRPDAPPPACKDSSSQQERDKKPPLYDQLSEIADGVQYANYTLGEIYRRLEL